MSRELPTPDRKLLWARAANMCSFTGCRVWLTATITGTVVAEEAHIRSDRTGGPRWDPDYPADQVHRYYNRILLCPNHHTLVDRDVATYPVETLEAMKRTHEQWVVQALSDGGPGPVETRYSNLVQGWSDRFLDGGAWEVTRAVWRPRMLMPSGLRAQFNDGLTWLYTHRLREGGHYARLEKALEQFERVATALQNVLMAVLEPERDEYLWFPPSVYRNDSTAVEPYSWVHALACDLAYELGRAAVAVVEAVRLDGLDPLFRLEDGIPLVGEEDGFGAGPQRVWYRPDDPPFESVESFVLARSTRDRSVGQGLNQQGLDMVWRRRP